MTKSDWLSAASIVMTAVTMLLSPLWGWWIIKRITQPKPNPAMNTDAKRANWIEQLVCIPWLIPSVVIIFNIYQLRRDVHSTAPLNRQAVLKIALDVALVSYACIGVTVLPMISALRALEARQHRRRGRGRTISN